MDRKFKGVFIPREIWENKDISSTEKLLWGEIWSLSDNKDGCFASNKHFSEFLGVQVRHMQKLLSNLESLQYITISANNFWQRRIYTYDTKDPPPVINDTPPVINDTPPVINDTHINNTLYWSNTLLYSSSYSSEEKEEEKYICSVEELKNYLPWKKIQDEIPYKDIEREMVDFFIYHEDKGKKIPKSTVSLRFGHWLKPKYETEHDRKILMAQYRKKNAQIQAFKSSTIDSTENLQKQKIESIESVLSSYDQEELYKLREESDKKFNSLNIKTQSEKHKKSLEDLYFENFIRKLWKKQLKESHVN